MVVSLGAAVAAVPLSVGTLGAYGLGTACCLAVVLALGYQVTFGLAGMLSLAVAPLMGVGAYAVAVLMTRSGWSFWATVAVAVALAALVGALVGLPALRVRGDVLALVTLGAGEILQTLYLHAPITGGYQGISAVPQVSAFGVVLFDRGIYLLCLAAALAVLLAVWALQRSPVGRAWTAVRDDEVAARAFGIRPGGLRVLAFAVGSGIAGLAGGLYAVQNAFVSSVSFGLAQTVVVILIVLVAGSGRLVRTVLAAVAFTVVTNRFVGYGTVSEGLTGTLILLVVAFRLGLADALNRRLRGWRERLRPQQSDPDEGPVSLPPVDSEAAPEAPVAWQVSNEDRGLVVESVSRSFGGVRALDGVSLQVAPGEVVGLVGPNGSGKTTLVNVLTGTLAADEGRLLVDGVAVSSSARTRPAQAGVVRTFQALRLFEGLTVFGNVLVGAQRGCRLSVPAALLRGPGFRRRERALRTATTQALAEVGLLDLAGRPVGALSHGQRRRVELARAFAARPAYLVLDEPGAGLDPEQTAVLSLLLRAHRDQGCGLLVVEHNVELLERLCDRAVGVAGGRVVASGPLAEVVRAPELSAHLQVVP